MTDDVPALETRGLTKRYGPNRGVEDLSFRVERGEVFGFLGPNGAGKSTTIRALLGLQRPTAGSASVLGLDSWHQSVETHRHVGYLPGEVCLFGRMTGRDHVDRLGRARGGVAPESVHDLTERLQVVLDRPVGQLSKGNRQKLGILLALMHRPDVLVLDEPSSGLDPLMQTEFHRLLREAAAEGRTVFLSSHELDEVQRVADRVAIIKEGRLVVTDTVDRLRSTAPQTIRFRPRLALDRRRIEAVPGVRNVLLDGDTVELELVGPIGPLLGVLQALDPIDFTARQADLDELFLRYYRADDGSRAN